MTVWTRPSRRLLGNLDGAPRLHWRACTLAMTYPRLCARFPAVVGSNFTPPASRPHEGGPHLNNPSYAHYDPVSADGTGNRRETSIASARHAGNEERLHGCTLGALRVLAEQTASDNAATRSSCPAPSPSARPLRGTTHA